jgi:hypothetical protein
MALRLLVDECLSPVLVNVGHQHGFEAHHVVHRGWEQIRLFDIALRTALTLSNPPDLVNSILEVDVDGSVRAYDLPEEES